MAIILISAIVGSIYLLLRRLGKRQTRRKTEQMINDVQAGKIKQKYFDATIKWDATGFIIQTMNKESEKPVRMNWTEVAKTTAYKRDLFSADLICIFFAKADGTGVEVHEESNGWRNFIEALPDFLPGCKPTASWWNSVAVPAFAANPTIIFDRLCSLPGGGAC